MIFQWSWPVLLPRGKQQPFEISINNGIEDGKCLYWMNGAWEEKTLFGEPWSLTAKQLSSILRYCVEKHGQTVSLAMNIDTYNNVVVVLPGEVTVETVQ